MRSVLWLLLCLVILQCIFITFGQDEDEDDHDFAILDELEDRGCDGSCKAPGRDKVPEKKKKAQQPQQKKRKSPQEQQQEIQMMMAQYQHYLQYMEEQGSDEDPLSPQEFMEYMNYMKAGQEAGLSPEEIQQKYAQEMQQKAMQTPEMQEELKKNLPDLNAKYKDKAFASVNDIPSDILNIDKIFGCGVVKIPAGKFYMGSEQDENYEEDGEAPYRKVKISNSFYMDACEVTNAQFLQFWDEKKMKGIFFFVYNELAQCGLCDIFLRQNRGRKIWMVICI